MRAFLVFLAFLFVSPALAQEQEEKGRFVRYVEETISSDNFQIRLNGLEGTLSSNVSLDSITIADREGVYLTIVEPQLEWSRSALLRGKLDIEKLTARRIEYTRPPVADESLPDPEAAPFAIPDLPVTIEIEELNVGEIVLTQAAVGLDARLSLGGRVVVDDGVLDVNLAATRLDGPGGQFKAVATYGGAGENVAIDVVLDEPAGGIVATLAGLEGAPPVTFTAKGQGSLADLTTDIRFAVSGEEKLGGTVKVADSEQGRRIVADLGGPFSSILPANVRPFVGGRSELDASVLLRPDGSTVVEQLSLDSGSIDLGATAFLRADGFLSALNLDLDLKDNDGDRVTLDLAQSQLSLADGNLRVRYDAEDRSSWRAKLIARDLRSPDYSAGLVDVTAEGTVTNLRDAAQRAITFDLDGLVSEIGASDPALLEALGQRITIKGSGATEGGGPIRIDGLAVEGGNFAATADGTLDGLTFDGTLGLRSANLDAFSAIAGRDLGGGADIRTVGTVNAAGTFDLMLDGTTTDLRVGVPALRPLLAGTTTLSGGAARGVEGLKFDELAIRNDQFTVDLDGRFASEIADLTLDGRLNDVGILVDQASGAVTFEAKVQGDRTEAGSASAPYDVSAQVRMAQGMLAERAVENLELRFNGTTPGDAVDGNLAVTGFVGGESVALDTQIQASAETQALRDLRAQIGATALEGGVTRDAQGLLEGSLTIASDDVSALAALAATQASGAVNGTVELSKSDSKQDVKADLEVRSLEVAGNTIGRADVDATVADAFGTPIVDAEVSAADIKAGGIEVRSLDATAQTEGNRTAFDVQAELAQAGARIAAEGAVIRDGARTTVELNRLTGSASGAEIRLREPGSVTLENGVTSFDSLALQIGDGAAEVSGSVGETLDIRATLDRLPLDIANAVAPELGLDGRVSGNAVVTGTPSAPDVTFDVTGEGLTAAQVRQAGIEPLAVEARGAFRDNTVTLETATITNPQGVSVDVAGTVPLSGSGLDVRADIRDLPLALANTVAPELGLSGTVSGSATATGSVAQPDVTFDITGRELSAAQVRQAGVAPLAVEARGTFRNNVVRLERAAVTNPQGVSATASGTVPLSGDGLDVRADIDNLPLALANTVAPELGLSGTASGSARATGSIANPQAEFDVSARGVSANVLEQNGVAPLTVNAAGSFADQTLDLRTATVTNGQGVSVSASGRAPIDGRPVDISVAIDRLPLTLANAVRPELDAQGTITGSAQVAGPISAPRVDFDLDGAGVSVAQLAQNGIDPISASIQGTFENNAVTLRSANVANGQGVRIDASGRVPLDGGALSVNAEGTAPLSLIDSVLADRGTRGSGTVRFNASVGGTLANPQPSGLVSLSGGTITDPLSNLRLQNVGALASLQNDRVVINRARAELSTGGSVAIDGTVGIAPPFEANLSIALNDARYTDAETFTTTVDGNLRVTGALTQDPLLSGSVDLVRTEITVPESFGGAGDLLEVVHVQPTAEIERTLARLADTLPKGVPEDRPSILNLDVQVNAPNRIFVRGRGLDAELGGSVRVRGPVNGVEPVGAFRLIRGRLNVIGRRFVLDEGRATLTGDLDPFLNFRATVQADEVTAFIVIRGRASDLEITFESDPPLPQDEVLAQIIFGKSLTDLGPGQIARLVAIAQELTGDGSPGLVDRIRAGTGLDDLDVVTTESGGTAVQAGKYISDNVYLGVQAGEESEATINLDITDTLTAKGSVGTSGESEIGIFYKKDY